MHSSAAPPPLLLLHLLLHLLLLTVIIQSIASFNVVIAAAAAAVGGGGGGENPFTPKGYAIRYWDRQISNDLPKPSFFLDKASPLTAAAAAAFSKLADDPNSLSTRFADFCIKANLFCFADNSPNLKIYKSNVNFTSYLGMNFTNYGTARIGGADSFKNYSDEANVATDNFRSYGRHSTAHKEGFTSYGTDVNLPDHTFKGYGGAATGGGGEFSRYQADVNLPSLRFNRYSDEANGRTQTFTQYSNNSNSGYEGFTNYARSGNGDANDFSNYGRDSNVMTSSFKNYGEAGNGGRDAFSSYGQDGNAPANNFKNYGHGGNGAAESFTTYRNASNIGDDDFQSYGKHSNAAVVDFKLYGNDLNGGSSSFTGYGQDAALQKTDFKVYSSNTTFKMYAKEGVSFASYANETNADVAVAAAAAKGKMVNNPMIEPGKFFLEEMLKSGSVMPMPNIHDKMPKRSFLPRAIVSKLPFSMSSIDKLKNIFHVGNDSSMANILVNSLNECERAPSPGETKRCVGSIEDMIDFSTSVLGRDVMVRTTENTQGSNGNIMLGQVIGINGGNVTKAVSCHQSLFPYLLYYCHAVPMVRVYEADILDPNSKVKINRGIAICHVDTSSWSSGHGAFVALGSGPGKIEVCHWIFENDMNWTTTD